MATFVSRGLRMLAALFLSAFVAGCGTSPASPSASTSGVTGTWVDTDRTFTWSLVQSGTTVTGTHTDARSGEVTPIIGEIAAQHFEFRVITGERVVTFLDPPQTVDVGWGAQADVDGSRMTGSIFTIGSPFRYSFREITMRRLDR